MENEQNEPDLFARLQQNAVRIHFRLDCLPSSISAVSKNVNYIFIELAFDQDQNLPGWFLVHQQYEKNQSIQYNYVVKIVQ